jgi:putative sporulation protein YtaF
MGLFTIVIIAIAVSIDGFWGGFAFGLRRIKILPLSLLIIASWSVVCTMLAMLIGVYLKNYITFESAKYIGTSLLVLLGVLTLKEGYKQKKERLELKKSTGKYNFEFSNLFKVLRDPTLADYDHENDIKPLEGTLLGIAVAMDASIAAFTLALMGASPFTTPFLFAFAHFVMIGLGNIIARMNIINHYAEKFALLPGFILILLGLLRLV